MKRYIARIAGAAFLFLGALVVGAQETPTLPNTKPGQLLSQWLKICDAADAAQAKQWGEENLSERALQRVGADGFATRMVRDCRANGGYRLLRVTQSQAAVLDVLTVARKTHVYVQVRIGVTPDGKTQGVGSMPTVPPESALPKDSSDKAIAAWLDSYADALAQTDQFSGIAVIARGTQPIATKSAGFADRARKTPITARTQFTLGSMGKMFTAAAVGQLVDQGRMSFDDVVGKFFPQFANRTVREKVTVAMLLSHTAGMGDFLGRRTPAMMKGGVKRAAEFVPLYEKDEPQFEPGTSWSYSNAGLALAGAIVEQVSGEDYPAYIRKHIFEAAGMKNSDPNNLAHADPRLVTPYTAAQDAGGRWREAEHDIGSPAGGAISTAEDLVMFADALRGGKLVTRPTFEKMVQGRDTPMGGQYGYAIEIDGVYGRKVVGHGGGFPGVSTHLYIVLDSLYTVVVLANQDPPAAEMVGESAMAVAAARARKGTI